MTITDRGQVGADNILCNIIFYVRGCDVCLLKTRGAGSQQVHRYLFFRGGRRAHEVPSHSQPAYRRDGGGKGGGAENG